jgi:hypothetical protein
MSRVHNSAWKPNIQTELIETVGSTDNVSDVYYGGTESNIGLDVDYTDFFVVFLKPSRKVLG